jgi:hypothetical protein
LEELVAVEWVGEKEPEMVEQGVEAPLLEPLEAV